MKFEILNLNPDLLKGIDDLGFERCTPVQEQSLPECLAGKDLISQSQTGTGKTAVFVITIYDRLLRSGWTSSGKPKALVIAPTRELAVQIEHDARLIGRHLPFKSVVIYGGVEYEKQVSALKSGVDLVVATPGRMIDLYKTKRLSLDAIEFFVIDEADRMFDMGFAPDVRYIAGRLPKNLPRQTMLFSATIDSNVYRLSSRYMRQDAVFVEIEPEQVTVDTIEQKIFYVSNEEKLSVLMGLLKREGTDRVIIFTNMKRTAEMLEWKLVANGFPARALTGDVTQAKRQKIIDQMKSGDLGVLVATDVVARGLHIDDVSHVINYDLPDESANYVHRIGRTARAGKSGKAYSLVCEDHVLNLPEIEKYIESKIETEWMDEDELFADTSGDWRKARRKAAHSKGASSLARRSGSGSRAKGASTSPRRSGSDSRPRPPEKSTDKAPQAAKKQVLPSTGPSTSDAAPATPPAEAAAASPASPASPAAPAAKSAGRRGRRRRRPRNPEGAKKESLSAERPKGTGEEGRKKKEVRTPEGSKKETSSAKRPKGDAERGQKKKEGRTPEGAKGASRGESKKRPSSSTGQLKRTSSAKRGRSGRKPTRAAETKTAKPPAPGSPEERLAYYRKQYGEDFPTGETPKAGKSKKTKSTGERAGAKKSGGVLKRILKVFGND